MTDRDFSSIIERVSDLVPDFLETCKLPVLLDQGLFHSASKRLRSSRGCRASDDQALIAKLSDIPKNNLCAQCFHVSELGNTHPAVTFIWNLVLLKETLDDRTKMLRRTGSRLALAAESVDKTLAAAFVWRTDLFDVKRKSDPLKEFFGDLSSDDEDRFAKLESQLRDLIKELKTASRTPVEREKVREHARQRLRPQYDSSFTFDETPTLVGIANFNPLEWSGVVKSVVTQFSIREDQVVLLVPRFIADYLVSLPSAIYRGLQPPVSVDGLDEAVIDTAAKLWDPSSNGPYVSLHGATMAAKSLEG